MDNWGSTVSVFDVPLVILLLGFHDARFYKVKQWTKDTSVKTSQVEIVIINITDLIVNERECTYCILCNPVSIFKGPPR